MKLAECKVKLFSEADAASLETAINAFLVDSGERSFISLQYQLDGSAFTALLTYTE